LVSPLTRRVFASNGTVIENLSNERAQTRAAAVGTFGVALDLNIESTHYVNAIGEKEAHKLDLVEGDHTHLNAMGGKVFGNMVAGLLVNAASTGLIIGLDSTFIKVDADISANIKAGKPV
jgi:hypothetical protein